MMCVSSSSRLRLRMGEEKARRDGLAGCETCDARCVLWVQSVCLESCACAVLGAADLLFP